MCGSCRARPEPFGDLAEGWKRAYLQTVAVTGR